MEVLVCLSLDFSEIYPPSQVFGEVAEGLETLTRINEAYVDEKGRPYRNIRYAFYSMFFIILYY